MGGWIAASRAWEAVSIRNPPRTTTPSLVPFVRGAQGTGQHGAADHSQACERESLALIRGGRSGWEIFKRDMALSDSSFLEVP